MSISFGKLQNSNNPEHLMDLRILGNINAITCSLGMASNEAHTLGLLSSVPMILILIVSQLLIGLTVASPAEVLRTSL